MEPYLYHGIGDYNLDRLINILKCGYILPKKMLPDNFKVYRKKQLDLNGISWISLSQKSLYDDYLGEINPSSFDTHIYNHPCIVINPNIEGKVLTSHILYDYYGPDYLKSLLNDESNDRYSTYMDEVQTNIPIPINKFLAVGYPIDYFKNNKSSKEIKSDIEIIKKLIKSAKLDIPIVDSSNYEFADNKEKIKKYTIH